MIVKIESLQARKWTVFNVASASVPLDEEHVLEIRELPDSNETAILLHAAGQPSEAVYSWLRA